MTIELCRSYHKEGTNGTLFVFGKAIMHTIELPWKENEVGNSCIPEGTYRLRKRYSQRFKWHVEVMDVDERSFILFHPANNALKELRGCIAPVQTLIGKGLGIQSLRAFQQLKARVFPRLSAGEEVLLRIKEEGL